VWYVAPLEMNEGTHWGQGYNRLTNSCSAADRPNKRPLTFNRFKVMTKGKDSETQDSEF
jgi:hypothetical protein